MYTASNTAKNIIAIVYKDKYSRFFYTYYTVITSYYIRGFTALLSTNNKNYSNYKAIRIKRRLPNGIL